MSKEVIQAEVYTCDGCSKTYTVEQSDMPPGYHGTAFEVSDTGGSADVSWFACRKVHITPAVAAVIKRSYEEN
jgi:hypothetical protein